MWFSLITACLVVDALGSSATSRGSKVCKRELLQDAIFVYVKKHLPVNTKKKKTTIVCVDPKDDPNLTTSGYFSATQNVIVLDKLRTVKIMADTALFELGNAEAANKYLEIDRALRNSSIPVIKFGRQKAIVESDVTYDYVSRIKELYSDLSKATEQARKAAAFIAQYPSKEAYQKAFIESPHSSSPSATFPSTLPTEEMYVYTGLVYWRGAKVYKRYLHKLPRSPVDLQTKLKMERVNGKTFKKWLWNDYRVSRSDDRVRAYTQVFDFVEKVQAKWKKFGLSIKELEQNIKRMKLPPIVASIGDQDKAVCSKYRVPQTVCNSRGILAESVIIV